MGEDDGVGQLRHCTIVGPKAAEAMVVAEQPDVVDTPAPVPIGVLPPDYVQHGGAGQPMVGTLAACRQADQLSFRQS